jgi:hypothetical protein
VILLAGDPLVDGLPASCSSTVKFTLLIVRISLPALLWTSVRTLGSVGSHLYDCCFSCWASVPAFSFFSSFARRTARS